MKKLSRITVEQTAEVLASLGGTIKSAKFFGVSNVTICNWRKLGMPQSKYDDVYESKNSNITESSIAQ